MHHDPISRVAAEHHEFPLLFALAVLGGLGLLVLVLLYVAHHYRQHNQLLETRVKTLETEAAVEAQARSVA
jgi:hypothetical protein